ATGRVRDAHLLWNGPPESRRVVAYERGGPFWERVETADGAVRTSLRPFLRTEIRSAEPDVSHLEVLWPLYSREKRVRETAWRFLFFFGMDKDGTDEAEVQDRTWLFPLWFSGTSRDGRDYAALFPFGGTIREMYWERVSFALFPLWCEWDRAGHHTWSALWPFVQRQTGGGRDAWRVLPFWGRTRVDGKMESRFVLWPVWTQAEHFGRNPGSDWMLWPLLGRVDRQDESARLFLPPLFTFAYGRGRTPEYRKVNCPWPLVMVRDSKDSHLRWFFPFRMHRWTEDGNADNLTVLWPFWNERRIDLPRAKVREWTLFPVAHSSVISRVGEDGAETLEENYMRVWPFWSRRYDPSNRLVKVPDFSFRKRSGQLERNLLGMFTLYTRGEAGSGDGGRRVDHEALWGLWRRGRGDGGYRFDRLWPFWELHEEDGDSSLSLLCGVVRRDNGRWRWFRFRSARD
ncbi:MAG: hypothetical protein IJ783_07990, partial [Kiritimatiellae bacterium]|nr:hypothetical protein [Kiritimatiellia bacterium]